MSYDFPHKDQHKKQDKTVMKKCSEQVSKNVQTHISCMEVFRMGNIEIL